MTGRTPLGRVRFAAVHTAMQAWFGQVTPENVRALSELAVRELPEGCPTREAVCAACADFEKLHYRKQDVQTEWGDALRAAMLTLMRPDPVDAHRRDIHG